MKFSIGLSTGTVSKESAVASGLIYAVTLCIVLISSAINDTTINQPVVIIIMSAIYLCYYLYCSADRIAQLELEKRGE